MRAGTDTENLSRRSPRAPHHEGQRREQAGRQPGNRGGLAAQRLPERPNQSGASAGGLGAGHRHGSAHTPETATAVPEREVSRGRGSLNQGRVPRRSDSDFIHLFTPTLLMVRLTNTF